MSTTNRYAAQLPDAYAKDDDSTNSKLLRINLSALDGAFADAADTRTMVDLDKTSGRTLDYYGEMVGQQRGGLDDTQYRYLVRNRIARNFVVGDYESVLTGIVNIFEADKRDIVLDDEPGESGVVHVTRLPFSILAAAGFTASQALQMIKPLLPVGVRIEATTFEGTFKFAAADDDYDEDAGFSDDPDPALQTMGGYFGFALGEDESAPLPIVN